MTPIWFGSLATVMHLLAKKIKISHMVWINRFCGTVLTIYGIKLFIDGVTMLAMLTAFLFGFRIQIFSHLEFI